MPKILFKIVLSLATVRKAISSYIEMHVFITWKTFHSLRDDKSFSGRTSFMT